LSFWLVRHFPTEAPIDPIAIANVEFARGRALRIPVATLRNWKQERVRPEPAARSLLAVYRNPKAVLAALAA
jgi:DNA-binding transcriptional regulator YiaG